MNIQHTAIKNIFPYEKNAKKHPKTQIQQIINSIKEFGFNQPIVVDKNGVIIVGHGRHQAAEQMGLKEVPVVVVDLSEEQAKSYRLADNKLNESEWDMKLVVDELKELNDVYIDLSGFDKDLIIENEEKDDATPEMPEAPRSAIGDIYELDGGHRIVCGDSTDINTVEKLMNGRKADMWITDPPYNVNYEGKTKDALKIDNDQMDDASFAQFLSDAFVSAIAYLKAGGVFYIWHADSEGLNFRQAIKNAGQKVRQCLVWKKNVMVMGRQDYQWKHEPCLYGWKEGASHLWNSDRKQTTILDFDKPSRNAVHPTMKPVELFAYQIGNNTKGEDIVLDTFLGSGTTLVACQKLGRICYGIELDPKYVDVVVQRWVDYTGNTTVIKNGNIEIWSAKEQENQTGDRQ